MPRSEKNKKETFILIFGEVLYDCFPGGHRVLGGAPFNVAWSLTGFGRDPLFVSSIGEDADGIQVKSRMQDWGMSTEALQSDPTNGTGEVLVSIEGDEPAYEIREDRAWDFIRDGQYSANGIIYHGSLALRSPTSHESLQRIVNRSGAQRFFDINLRPPHVNRQVLTRWVQDTDWLKLNIDELRTLLKDPGISFASCNEHLDQLRRQYSIRNVLLTGGSQGAVLSGDYGEASYMPAPHPEEFVDTVGAGDAFSAAAIDGILSNRPAEQLIEVASRFAARVCGLRGATTKDHQFYQNKYNA